MQHTHLMDILVVGLLCCVTFSIRMDPHMWETSMRREGDMVEEQWCSRMALTRDGGVMENNMASASTHGIRNPAMRVVPDS